MTIGTKGQVDLGIPLSNTPHGLTAEEKNVLTKLADAWNAYIVLNETATERHRFAAGIDALICMVSCRVAERSNPEYVGRLRPNT